MSDRGETPVHDPYRTARQAVSEGRFREALQLLTGIGNGPSFTPEWHLLMAMASWRLGDFAESHEAAGSALAMFRTRGDVDGEMRAQNVAAAGAFAMGKLDEARKTARESLKDADSPGARESLEYLDGLILTAMGRPSKARKSFARAYETGKKEGRLSEESLFNYAKATAAGSADILEGGK